MFLTLIHLGSLFCFSLLYPKALKYLFQFQLQCPIFVTIIDIIMYNSQPARSPDFVQAPIVQQPWHERELNKRTERPGQRLDVRFANID